VRIHDGESPLLPEALQAFLYLQIRHVPINLVILNDQDTSYALDLHNAILRQIRRMGAETWLNQREGIFVLRTTNSSTPTRSCSKLWQALFWMKKAERWRNTPFG